MTKMMLCSGGCYSKRSIQINCDNFFSEWDISDSGVLTLRKFEEHLDDPKVLAWLHKLDIEVCDAWTLFKLLDNRHRGFVTMRRFVDGLLQMKGGAKSIQIHEILYQNRWLLKHVGEIHRELRDMRVKVSRQSGQHMDRKKTTGMFTAADFVYDDASERDEEVQSTTDAGTSIASDQWAKEAHNLTHSIAQDDPMSPRKIPRIVLGHPRSKCMASQHVQSSRFTEKSSNSPFFHDGTDYSFDGTAIAGGDVGTFTSGDIGCEAEVCQLRSDHEESLCLEQDGPMRSSAFDSTRSPESRDDIPNWAPHSYGAEQYGCLNVGNDDHLVKV